MVLEARTLAVLESGGEEIAALVYQAKGRAAAGLFVPPHHESPGLWIWYDHTTGREEIIEDVENAAISSDSTMIFLSRAGETIVYQVEPWKAVNTIDTFPPSARTLRSVGEVVSIDVSSAWKFVEKDGGVFMKKRADILVIPGRLVAAFGDGEAILALDPASEKGMSVSLYTLDYYKYKRKISREDS